MNIIEAYIKFNSQLIILISGFSGSGKTLLGRNIQRDFKLQFINLNDYYKENYNNIHLLMGVMIFLQKFD